MVYAIIIFIVVVIISIGIAYVLVKSYQSVSIDDLKVKGRVKDIIGIYQDVRNDAARRREAIAALVEIGTPDAFNALVGGLAKSQTGMQKQLVAELPRAGAALFPYLRQAFANPASRAGAVRIMAAIGPESCEVLFPFMGDGRSALREESVQALEEVGWKPGLDANSALYWMIKKQPEQCVPIGAAALPVLIAALNDPALVEDAIAALGEIHDPSAAAPLLNLSRNPKYALQVVKALARLKESGLPVLYGAMKAGDPQVRQTAMSVLDLMNWAPTKDEVGARYWAAKKNWAKLIELGQPALAPLEEMLAEKDREVRRDVIHTLGLLGVNEAAEKLIGVLKEADKDDKLAAIEALGRIKSGSSVGALVEIIGDDGLYPAQVAALVVIGNAAKGALVATLRSSDLHVRKRAAEALELMGWQPANGLEGEAYGIARQDWEDVAKRGQSAVDLLIEELGHPQNCVNAARVLTQIGDERAIKPIIFAFSGKSHAVQQSLAEALGGMGAAAVDPLLEALDNGQIERLPVITALGLVGEERAARPLTNFLKDSFPWSVREAAAMALGLIGLPALDPILEALLEGGIDPRAAGLALGEAGNSARDRLITALKSKKYDAQVLVYALGKIHDEESATAVLATLREDLYGLEIRNSAEVALLEIGMPAVRPLITALMRNPKDKAYIGGVLVKFGSPVVEILLHTLKDSFFPAQSEAIVEVLGEIGDQRAVTPLVELIKNRTVNVEIAKEALDKIWKKHRKDAPREGSGRLRG